MHMHDKDSQYDGMDHIINHEFHVLEGHGTHVHTEEYVQSNVAAWRAAPAPASNSEGPALPPSALQQLLGFGQGPWEGGFMVV